MLPPSLFGGWYALVCGLCLQPALKINRGHTGGLKVRKRSWFVAALLLLTLGSIFPLPGFAQSAGRIVTINASPDSAAFPQLPQRTAESGAASRIGVQAKFSTLGFGGEVGIAVLPKANVRAGFALYNFSHTFSKDGIAYDGTLRLRSVNANFDWYLIGPFHISPGVLLYNGFRGAATAAVAGGQTFTLGSTTYQSSTATPLNGSLDISPKKAAPELLIGFGNLVPRSHRHFTANVDLGVVFQGALNSTLALAGLACVPPNSTGPTCVNAATDPTVQANVTAQQTKLDNDLKAIKYYPVISFGIGFKF